MRNGGLKFAANKKLPNPEDFCEDDGASDAGDVRIGLPAKILNGNDDEDEETEKLRYRIAKEIQQSSRSSYHGPYILKTN